MQNIRPINYIEFHGKKDLNEKHNGLFDLIILAICVFFAWAVAFKVIYVMNVLLMALYSVCAFVQLKEKRYGNLFFYLTFFLFLLDTVFFGLFKSEYKYNFADDEAERFALTCLAIAIIGVYIGSVVEIKRRITLGRKSLGRDKLKDVFSRPSAKLQSFLKVAFIVCVQCSIAEAMFKAIFVSANSYVAYYTDFQTPLPYAAVWISTVSPIIFYFFLGTLPDKKAVRVPCTLYLLVGVIALFYGQRNVLVIRMLIVVCYFLLRQRYSSRGETWITKKQVTTMILLIPMVIVFMSFWNSFRFKNEYESKGVVDSVIEGLLEQGNDISILDYEYTYGERLPDKPYALGGIISFARNNVVSRILGVPSVPTQHHTVDMALNGYSYSGALMYLQNRNGYLAGFGIGSCYIAELFNTFGYIGVFIGSFIYGVVLKMLTKFRGKGFISSGFALYMFQMLLMAPRASYDAFISFTFQVANIFVALVCWALSKYVWPSTYEDLEA